MRANPDYDLSRPLASALRAKAPYVGIPIPGHAPLIFNRLFLSRCLNGIRPVNIEVQILENGERLLIVDGVSPEYRLSNGLRSCVRHHMKVRSLRRTCWADREAIEKEMDKWKPCYAAKATAPRQSKHDKAIVKLEKQLAKLGKRPEICNPCLSHGNGSDSQRATWQRWYQQKALRGKIGALAAQARKAKMTSRQFYVALAELTTVKRFSDLNTREKEMLCTRHDGGQLRSGGSFFDYVDPKKLWRFLPGLAKTWGDSRPSLWGEAWDSPERWGARRYDVVLEWSRERQELLSQIAAVRAMVPINLESLKLAA
jgi:hypothetical protein